MRPLILGLHLLECRRGNTEPTAGLTFSVLSGVRSMNETFPLERVTEDYDRTLSGKARFRVVLTMGTR